MATLSSIASGARDRIRRDADEIRHSLKVIAAGRRGDAEPDESRRAAVLQARRGLSDADARSEAKKTGPESIWARPSISSAWRSSSAAGAPRDPCAGSHRTVRPSAPVS